MCRCCVGLDSTANYVTESQNEELMVMTTMMMHSWPVSDGRMLSFLISKSMTVCFSTAPTRPPHLTVKLVG